jgi:signal transduction histidine kinase
MHWTHAIQVRLVGAVCLVLGGIALAQDPSSEPVVNDRYWLTEEEKAWLAEHPVFTNAVIDGHQPFEFVDENGRHTGLTSDYMTIISEQLGVTFEPVIFSDFKIISREMYNGNIDVASYLVNRLPYNDVLSFTRPMISMPIAVFGRPDSTLILNIPSLDQWRVAVEKPSRAYEIFSRDFPQLDFVYVDSPVEGLMALHGGDVDYFIHNIFSVEYYQRKLDLAPLRIAATTPYSFDIQFATSRQAAPLVPMIQKVILGLSDYERTLIFDKWVNINVDDHFDWRKAFLWGGGALALILAVFSFVLYVNRRLAKEVESRTHDLQNSREELRALARHMDRLREEEKSRLAREIHDELGHTLTALAMSVRRFAKRQENPDAHGGEEQRETQQLTDLQGLVKQATKTSRRIMSDLRPSVLEDLGLVAAVEWLVHEFEQHHDIACELQAEDLEVELPSGAGIALFRIVQESLTNIAKHAEAQRAWITLTVENDVLTLEIADDGAGFSRGRRVNEHSFGLLGMSERALALGGELQLRERAEGGARIVVTVPLPQDVAVTGGGAAA